MAITDYITLFFSIFLLSRGASRGLVNSLLGPFSVIVATIISIIYYQITNQIILSLIIGLAGPLVLYFILKSLLYTWSRATNTDIQPNFLSRLGGAILTLAWGWVFIIFTLILLAVVPPMGEIMTTVHDDILRSRSYSVARPWEGIFFNSQKQNTPAAASSATSRDTQSLADDPRFQKVLQDPEIQKDINTHDFIKLMSNPKMLDLTKQIMSDPATFKKVMSVYSSSQKQIQASLMNSNGS